MASAQPADSQLSFRDKMKFFEKEAKAKDAQPAKPAKQFSYLAEHEIAKMKQEEATKTANMSSEQLRSYVASGVADMRLDHDLDHVLSSLNTRKMKSLETDAVHAQAVIAKAQQLSRGAPAQDADSGELRTNGSAQEH